MLPPKLCLLSTLLMISLAGCSNEKSASDYLTSATKFIDAGDYKSAIIEARNAVKNDTNNAEARKLLGSLELRNTNYQQSEKELRKAIELGIPANEVVLELSHALRRQGKNDELIELNIESVLADDKATVTANLAAAYLEKSQIDQADKHINSALQLKSDSSEALIVKAKIEAHKYNFEAARQHAQSALDASPDNAESWEFLGELELQDNNLDKAIVAFSNAIDNASNTLNPYLRRAQIYIQLRKYEDATKDFEKIEKAGIKHPSVFVGKSEILFQEGKYLEAQVQLEEALKLAPDYTPAVRSIAVVHMLLDNLGQAEQYAKQLLNANESNDARVLLASIRLQSSKYEQAQETLEPLSEIGALDIMSTRALSTVYLKQDKHEKAIDLISAVHKRIAASGISNIPFLAFNSAPAHALLNPGNDLSPDGQPYLSPQEKQIVDITRLIAQGSINEALLATDQLEKQMPNSATPHSLRGRAYLSVSDDENAAVAFKNALAITPANISASIKLAEIAGRVNPDSSAQMLQTLLGDAKGGDREDLMLRLAENATRTGNGISLLKWLNKIVSEKPNSFRANLALAQIYSAEAKHTDVLTTISSMDELSKKVPLVNQLEVSSLIHEKLFDDAVEKLTNLIGTNPQSADWYFLRAQAYAGKGNLDQVELDLQQALKLEPEYVPAIAATSNLKVSQNDLGSAKVYIDKLEGLLPESKILSDIKKKYASAKNTPAKTESRVEISNTEELLNAVVILTRNEEHEKAIQLLKKWLENNPTDLTAWTSLAELHAVLNQNDNTVLAYNKALKLSPDNFSVLNNLAWYLRTENPNKALNYIQQALDQQPESIHALDTMAAILLEQRKFSEAKDIFNKLQDLGASDPNIIFHGALIEFNLDNKKEARALLSPIMESNVDFAERKKAEKLFSKL